MPKKRRRLVQFDLWGKPIREEVPHREGDLIPLEFEGKPVTFSRKREGILVSAAECCKIANLKNVSQALSRLDDDEKVLISNETPGGTQKMWFVTEEGFYSLLLSGRLRKNQEHYEFVKSFRRWVTHEVLPSIRKTGTYSVKPKTRVDRESLRLKCDPSTAKIRCDQFAVNLSSNLRLAAEGACPRDHQEWYNSSYRGGYNGMDAAALRAKLGMKRGTPLDRMDAVPLTINLCAKAIVEKLASQAREDGKPMALADQAKMLEQVTRELTVNELKRFGDQATLGFTDDPRRGLILDVVRAQIAS